MRVCPREDRRALPEGGRVRLKGFPWPLARFATKNLGTAVGVLGSFKDLGLILGPPPFGVVHIALGPRDLFPITATLAPLDLVLALAVQSSRPGLTTGGSRRTRFGGCLA